LTGYTERKDGEQTRHPGALDAFSLSRADAEAMIMAARVKAGWITEADLNPPVAEAPAEAAADAAPAPAA
jgi:N utilization substance protein A